MRLLFLVLRSFEGSKCGLAATLDRRSLSFSSFISFADRVHVLCLYEQHLYWQVFARWFVRSGFMERLTGAVPLGVADRSLVLFGWFCLLLPPTTRSPQFLRRNDQVRAWRRRAGPPVSIRYRRSREASEGVRGDAVLARRNFGVSQRRREAAFRTACTPALRERTSFALLLLCPSPVVLFDPDRELVLVVFQEYLNTVYELGLAGVTAPGTLRLRDTRLRSALSTPFWPSSYFHPPRSCAVQDVCVSSRARAVLAPSLRMDNTNTMTASSDCPALDAGVATHIRRPLRTHALYVEEERAGT
ncbi:hypothetical protein EXIGLDRAFT_57714 [Exidia glandulosa HHB12029]|uniref:Uncharacterized protein n=1 Tax=Exidia glandulosa HHB12029 TaxID=1314781 RepID=A0A166MML9_EXIGL|nr:hypothetical protein EXIGLDRAFT_57714 [Exidia glandulosa HHB12029]